MPTPLELLENKNDRIRSVMSEWFFAVSSAALTFGCVCYVNYHVRRPVFSGIQKHIFFPIVAGVIVKKIDEIRDVYYAERDAVFRHYVQLHPEDFIMPERKKFGDLFQEWYPIR